MKKVFLFAVLICSFTTAQAQLGGVLKKAAKDKVANTPAPSKIDLLQPDACIENVKGRLETIVNTYYVEFKNNPEGYIQKNGGMWFARKDYEVARFYYSGGKEGYRSAGRQCELGSNTADPRYQELKPLLEDAEAKLKEMEAAKGIEFAGVREEYTIIFKNVKTGKEYTANESNKL